MSVINMPMPDESVNAGLSSDFFPNVCEPCSLQSFPVFGLKTI